MKFVTDFLEDTANKFADKSAFIDESRQMSFKQLLSESRALGTCLAGSGAFQKPVCILMEKSASCIAAMMGVVYSGNFYTVLDADMPKSRIQKILDVLEPGAIVTDKANEEMAMQLKRENAFIHDIIMYEEAVKTVADPELLDGIKTKMNPESIFFVLFTSGSTGVPKGVIIYHKPIPVYLNWYADTFDFNETTVFANQAPFYFIMSCPEIYVTIMKGSTCYIVPKKAFSFPMVTLQYLKERHVNTLYWVPSVFCLIANFRALPEVHLDDLKLVMFGGEVMPAKQLNMWRREYPDVRFVNLYGPTETTEMISYYEVEGKISDSQSLPIGIPASYIQTMILDENGCEVAPGETGELCATGIALSGGYYKMPERTAQSFVPNPLYHEGDDPETRMIYKTGDLAKQDEDGNYIYMGRKDFQIKHMGNRIELGEIETAASSLDGVDRNCCLYNTDLGMIVMFYAGSADEESVEEGLRTLLPDYMIPNRMEKLDYMPMNVNGKIDRAALKEML